MLSTAKLVGELFRWELISGKVVNECIKFLIDRPPLGAVEGLK